MIITKTARGFRTADFLDHYNEACHIRESSLAAEYCIWLGIKKEPMHLTQDQVAALLPLLQHFVATGELPDVADPDMRLDTEALSPEEFGPDLESATEEEED